MKKYLLIIAILFATKSQAQTIDTVRSATIVNPVVLDAMNKDTLYQFTASVFGIKIKDSLPATSHVEFYDRKGKKIKEENIIIPFSVLSVWLDDSVIYNYIMQVKGLTRRN